MTDLDLSGFQSDWHFDIRHPERGIRAGLHYDAGTIETLDDTQLRTALNVRLWYKDFDIGSTFYYETLVPYSPHFSYPAIMLIDQEGLTRTFNQDQASYRRRFPEGHPALDYSLDRFIDDVRDAFGVYCRIQLDRAKEVIGGEPTCRILFRDICRRDALAELIRLECAYGI